MTCRHFFICHLKPGPLYGTKRMHGVEMMGGVQWVDLVWGLPSFFHIEANGKRVEVKILPTLLTPENEDRGITLCVQWTNVYQVIAIYQALARYSREQDRYNFVLLRQSWPAEVYNNRVKQHIYVIGTWGKKTRHREGGKTRRRWWLVRKTSLWSNV